MAEKSPAIAPPKIKTELFLFLKVLPEEIYDLRFHRRSASIGPSRYRIPGIATTEKKVGKRIWGKGMGAERNSHSLARNSLAIIIRDDCLIAIGVDRRPRDCRRIGRAVR
jgi:hypothetical protein